MRDLSRRDVLKLSSVAAAGMALDGPLLRAAVAAPAAPVAVARCTGYGPQAAAALDQLFAQLGGLKGMVAGKTVAVKVNVTGGPRQEFQGRRAGRTFHVHPDVVLAACRAFAEAGARRIRLLEGWSPRLNAEQFMSECHWDVAALRALSAKVELENTNNRGSFPAYSSLKPRHGGYVFPSFQLNRSYEDTDFFVSLAKMKNHYTSGVTLALKNCFGIAPSSYYGDDAGSERAGAARGNIFHLGKRQPAAGAAPELNPTTPRDDGYRVPRITVDLVNSIHPVNLSIVEGIESVQGGEGPWIKPLRIVEPGLLVAGLNPVCTDAVCTAIMGYDPAGDWGTPPFYRGDNTIKLAESAGLGTADLKRIEVRGLSIKDALYEFEPNA